LPQVVGAVRGVEVGFGVVPGPPRLCRPGSCEGGDACRLRRVSLFAVADDVVLRPVREDDLTVLDRIFTDPDTMGPFQWYGWRDLTKFRRRWAENGLLTDDSGTLMVVRAEEALGFVSWHKAVTSMSSYCWNVGIALLPECHGRGYGTQAQRLLVRYLFAHTQVQRIEAGTDVENVAEQRALEKVGFQREGVMRGHSFRQGAWHDTVLYSVLRGEVS
jgi:RimJ/RimL family protein N-acetyltransferase